MLDIDVGPSIDRFLRQFLICERALRWSPILPCSTVPETLVQHLAGLLTAERRRRGTRTGTRALTCHRQALLILVWFRKAEDATLLGAGFGISRATAYRYLREGITVLNTQAPDLHEALRRTAADGWAFVILDGKLF